MLVAERVADLVERAEIRVGALEIRDEVKLVLLVVAVGVVIQPAVDRLDACLSRSGDCRVELGPGQAEGPRQEFGRAIRGPEAR